MNIERIPITSRDQWLKLRRWDVTASDVAAVVGCSPYKTALQVYAEKTGKVREGGENAMMKRGRHLEDAVLNYLRDEKPFWHITKPGVYLRDTQARIGATPDAIAETSEGEFIVQCKVVSRPVFDAWDDAVPLAYQLQTLTEAMLWGSRHAFLAALAIDAFTAELRLFHVERHEEAEKAIRDAVARFWADVNAGKMPTADYERDAELIKKLYRPREEVEPVDLSANNRLPEILDERETLRRTVKMCEERAEAINAEIVEALKGATIGILPGWRLSHKVQHRREVVIPAKSFPVLRVTPERKQHE